MESVIADESQDSMKITSKNYLLEKYPLDLTMYLEPPNETISVEEIKEMAIERVKMFRAFEIASAKLNKGASFKELVIQEMQKENLRYFLPIVMGYPDGEVRKRDHISHFVLRICYCRSEEYKKWFLTRETEFFKLKFFNTEKKDDIVLFMKKNELNYIPLTDEEKATLSSELTSSNSKHVSGDILNIYKVYFTDVLDLVRKRKVIIKNGYAFVSQSDLFSVLLSLFKKNLMEELDEYALNLDFYESDLRIKSIVRELHTCYTGKDYSSVSGKPVVSKDSLNVLFLKSYPLCMKSMHETFKNTNHLKHHARLQYGLFLKGIGVSMEESLKFWKEGFTKSPEINADVFEKKYAYSIRHNYGNEGKRANYVPHNCIKIINTNVGPGDNHGCPYKHCDPDNLRKMLLNCSISPTDVSSIIDYASKGHYQLACTKYFEVTHKVTNAHGINHPNQYFENSRNLLEDQAPRVSETYEAETKLQVAEPKWDDDFDIQDISNVMTSVEEGMNVL